MKSHLHIAFFGSSLVSMFWNGAATYCRGIIRALAKRGHQVTFYEPDAQDYHLRRDMANPDWAKVVVYRGNSPQSALSAVQQARDADLIVKTSSIGVYDDLIEAAVLDLKRPGNLVLLWDFDAPATLERVAHSFSDPFRRLVRRYDLVITYGGGPAVIDGYKALGASRCVPIYNAVEPSTHFPAQSDPRFTSDLGFFGNRLPDRESRMDQFFLGAARLLPERTFLLGGSGWGERTLPDNVNYAGYIYPSSHNAFNSTPTAILSICRESLARHGYAPSTRIFEAAGAGACLISDAWDGLELFLEPGKEILVARTGAEIAQHLEDLDGHRAAAIGAAARARILAHHTYAHRVAQLEAELEGNRFDEARPVGVAET